MVAFGWGSMYLITKGIEIMDQETILVKTIPQTAATLESSGQMPSAKITIESSSVSDNLTIMVGGDVMFDRGIRAIGERNSYDSLFDESIVSLFKKANIVAVNLEGPITSYPSKTLVNDKITDVLTFTFSPRTRLTLKDAGITIVNLANNHVDNLNFLGFMETQDWLEDAGILWFGNPWNSTSTKMSREKTSATKSPIATVIEKNGVTVAFVGYHSFQLGIDRVIAEIKRVSGPNVFTIVMPHWGEEYTTIPSAKMKSQTQAFISAGADAVIGAHPHVIMEQEWIGDVPVLYSLGNLLFDQYFSPDVMVGNIAELHITRDGSGVHLDRMSLHENHLIKGKGVSLEQEKVIW
ncbi:MAG: hypothetical protein A2830_01545 [Candidatus Taylorbacteria bacterium RIFCSPHIGHO2_01_FULL_44_110]|nr:MAG: hypothetical protein A2830_01545 [Candidatus Taylorbacteria bacterium RIFCSPHIGHO2_01_FULL_44_110]OHA33354.1 MAG: hypothetical protein A3A23_01635 [Candidatus Taylorbacteria bacterium RIFCSPLOWO2_01_FULL_45_59]OHA38734.1 MAG: hypothetical protein A3I98_03470 [Candidatus Taylorbacteria bacterium RIFCSPLOWO2_02_FULL_45_10b]